MGPAQGGGYLAEMHDFRLFRHFDPFLDPHSLADLSQRIKIMRQSVSGEKQDPNAVPR